MTNEFNSLSRQRIGLLFILSAFWLIWSFSGTKLAADFASPRQATFAKDLSTFVLTLGHVFLIV